MEVFAKRLQIQEKLTAQIANTILVLSVFARLASIVVAHWSFDGHYAVGFVAAACYQFYAVSLAWVVVAVFTIQVMIFRCVSDEVGVLVIVIEGDHLVKASAESALFRHATGHANTPPDRNSHPLLLRQPPIPPHICIKFQILAPTLASRSFP